MNPAVLSDQSSIVITFLASFLIWIIFFGLFVLWIIDGRVKKELVLHALVSCLVAWGFAQMIKGLFPTLRPFELNGNVPMTFTVPSDGAFPSGHSAAAFAVATSVWLHNKKLGIIFLIAAGLVGYARVASHVHFLGDIIGGATLGILISYIFDKLHLKKLVS